MGSRDPFARQAATQAELLRARLVGIDYWGSRSRGSAEITVTTLLAELAQADPAVLTELLAASRPKPEPEEDPEKRWTRLMKLALQLSKARKAQEEKAEQLTQTDVAADAAQAALDAAEAAHDRAFTERQAADLQVAEIEREMDALRAVIEGRT